VNKVDRSLVGTKTAAFTVEVERGAIRRFAKAIEDGNRTFNDPAAANQQGYADLMSPVRPGDAITTIVTASSRRQDSAQPGIDCDIAAFVADRQVAEGKATVIWPGQQQARRAFGGIGERHG